MRGVKQDLTGLRFGRWTVIRYIGRDKDYNSLWLCRCDCGKEKVVYGIALKNGNSTSCGCYAVERSKKENTIHGHTCGHVRTPTFISWSAARQRTTDKNRHNADSYIGRGIEMCLGWYDVKTGFASFLTDMGLRPDGKTLDRWPDNDGGYTCGHCSECVEQGHKLNCRWATPKEQAEPSHRRSRGPNKS